MRVSLFACTTLASLLALGCNGAGRDASGGTSSGPTSPFDDTGSGSVQSPGTTPPTTSRAPASVKWVSPDGDDANPGTAEQPWRTPAHAVASVTPGTTVFLREGTYAPFAIDRVDGTESAPIRLVGAPGGARPLIRGGTVLVKRAHWSLEGIEVTPGAAFAVRFTGAGAHDSGLRESVLHDGAAGAGVSIDGEAANITIEGNEIYGFSRGGDIDSHGIVIQPRTSGTVVRGNEIHGNNGDSVQCIDPGAAGGGAPARDILIEGNRMFGDRENAVDIKTCENVVIRGNVAHGYSASATSKGEAVVIHIGANNVLVEKNDLSDSARGVVTGVGAKNVTIRRNVIHDGRDEKTGILLGQGSNFTVLHNTVVGMSRGVLVLAEASGVSVKNNVFSGMSQSVSGSAVVETNLFFDAPPVGSGAVTGDPLLDGEYNPAADSPAIGAAQQVEGENFCGSAPDLGAIERC